MDVLLIVLPTLPQKLVVDFFCKAGIVRDLFAKKIGEFNSSEHFQ